MKRDFGGIIFVVVNYEYVWRNEKKLIQAKFDMVVADEGHRLRRRSSKQSKSMGRIGRKSPYRLELTGTPQGRDEIDLWAQMRFINPDVFGPTWKGFEKGFIRKVPILNKLGVKITDKLRFKPNKRNLMRNMIAPHVFRISASEALDLPPVTHTEITFDLTGSARKAYRDLERDFIHRWQHTQSTTPLTITQMLRLHQVCGGFLGMDDGTLVQFSQDKLLAFSDWLDDYPPDEKLVVFARFTPEIDQLAALMKRKGRSYVIRDGRTPDNQVDDWMKFQDEKHPLTYIAQINSGGVGVELFSSRVGIFYSNSLSPIDYAQAIKRIDRNGQTRPVLIIHMIARNTIDEDMIDSLNEQGLMAEETLKRIQNRGLQIMAKKEKVAATTETKAKTSPTPPKKGAEFGPGKLAEALGMAASDVRVILRKGDYAERFKKDDVWNFGNQKTIDAVAKEIKAAQAKAPAKATKAAAEPEVTTKKTKKSKGE